MKTKNLARMGVIAAVVLLTANCFSQNNALVLNGGFVTLSGGTSGSPAYLVIDQSNALGITRTSGHIISEGEYNKVQWNVRTGTGIYTFHIGRTTATYIPFVFNKTTAGTESGTGTVRVSSWYTLNNAVWPNGTLLCGVATTEDDVVDRFWVIDVLNYSANPTATIRFNYADPLDIAGIPVEGNLQAQRWNSALGSACKWELPPTGTVDVTNNFVEVAGISAFSPWALVNKFTPLPIELLYFNAIPKNNKIVRTEWTTVSEINNDYFAVERSKDGITFEQVGTMKGAGNSSFTLNYFFYDEHPYSGTSYYRLKQLDYDGKYSYSEIKAVYIGSPEIISIYPNPAGDYIYYIIGSENGGIVTVKALDVLGKQLVNSEETIDKGVTAKKLNVSRFSSGLYLLQISTLKQEKFQKQFLVK